MLGYLREHAEFRRSWLADYEAFLKTFQTEDYFARKQRWAAEIRSYEKENPAAVVKAENFQDSAVVITTEPMLDRQARFRYHLHLVGETWRIHRREGECFACKASGRQRDKACTLCGGTGWKGYSPPDA
ncbi:conserved hypothetical protein [Verrucomicrobia bacterium]|nr:conserved hypothetical protein [Verrucomicrobiota bacterium]